MGGGFRHDLPAVAQHTGDMLVHCLHAWKQSLSVELPGPIPLVRIRLYFHLVIFGFSLHSLCRPTS